jgi:putative RNA 2'-phosphotransferase
VNQDLMSLSRTVSHALRHAPWLYELELDSEGWVSTDILLNALRSEAAQWKNLNESDLSKMIASSDKQRHEILNGKIRALYGHSLPNKLQKTEAIPPEKLFHGTSPQALIEIRAEGLKPMNRQYVHLSTDQETAQQVGKRKTAVPILLSIESLQAQKKGIKFYIGNDIVWLADWVPPEFIQECPIKNLNSV